LISSFEGNLIAEGNPTMRQLAYDIAKKIETKNLRFNKAYFGWVKFEMDRSAVIEFKTKVASLASILRLIREPLSSTEQSV
jgi:ribosomal protein S6